MTREQIIEILKNRECFNKYGQNYVYEFDYDLVAEDILSLTQQDEPSVSAEKPFKSTSFPPEGEQLKKNTPTTEEKKDIEQWYCQQKQIKPEEMDDFDLCIIGYIKGYIEFNTKNE